MGLLYANEVKPKVDVTFLVIKQRGRCRSSAVDDDGVAGLEQGSKFSLTKGEEKVALADEIDSTKASVAAVEIDFDPLGEL
jgi:hypothetical protein